MVDVQETHLRLLFAQHEYERFDEFRVLAEHQQIVRLQCVFATDDARQKAARLFDDHSSTLERMDYHLIWPPRGMSVCVWIRLHSQSKLYTH